MESVLQMHKMFFKKISFDRKGFKNDNKADFTFKTSVLEHSNRDLFKVSLDVKCNKEEEYEFEIELIGVFSFNSSKELDKETKDYLISHNTVSILMPYMRSQISLLTAQPDTDCVVLPPFNVNEMLDQSDSD